MALVPAGTARCRRAQVSRLVGSTELLIGEKRLSGIDEGDESCLPLASSSSTLPP